MVSYPQAFLLALIQGITEWLPVSSSAHLAIAQRLLGISPPVFFDIMLHMGTLIAVVVYFRGELLALVRGFFTLSLQNENFRYCLLVAVASVPTAMLGFAFHDLFASMFSDMPAIAAALTITGIAIYSSSASNRQDQRPLSVPIAVLIGVAQGIAVAPGISRSGATISAGLFAGLDREAAARFSFILSIPALLGAAIFEFRTLSFESLMEIAGASLFGAAVAAVIGYLSIAFLLDVIKRGFFAVFAYYCWALALVIVVLQVL